MWNKAIIPFICCLLSVVQTMAQSYGKDTVDAYSSYMEAKGFLNEDMSAEDKRILHKIYVTNGYLWACDLMGRDTKEGYIRAREVLEEIAPYSDETMNKHVLPQIPYTWYFQGAISFGALMFEESLMCFGNALEGFRKLDMLREEVSALKHMAYLKYHTDKIDESIGFFETALKLSGQTGDEASQMEVAAKLHKLYGIVGDMEQVGKYSSFMDSLYESTSDIQAKFNFYMQRGNEYKVQGEPSMAEVWFKKGEAVAHMGEGDFNGANRYTVYSNLRDLYLEMKSFENALEYAFLTLEESRIIGGTADKGFYMSYLPLVNIYSEIGDRENCLRYLDSLFVFEPYLEDPRELGMLYFTRGNCHSSFKDYSAALADYKMADKIMASSYPVTDGGRVSLYPIIGGMEHKLNNYKESEDYYRLYAEQTRNLYGEQSLKYIDALVFFANAQGFAGNIKEGCDNYAYAVHKLKNTIISRLPYMNTSEREGFWTPLSSLLTLMTPYALKAELYQTEFTETCYNALLMSKAFLLDSERSLSDIIKREGDEDDRKIFMAISSLANKIKEWEKDYSFHADSILAVSDRVNGMERKLMAKCKSFNDMTAFLNVDYDAVRKALGRKEILIDFTDFIPDEKSRVYAAYIIGRGQRFPLLKRLFNEQQIDSLGIVRPDMFYDREYSPDIVNLLWKPLEEHVDKGATVYYVPSRMLFQVCLESLQLEDGTLLGDHYNFVRLSCARELLDFGKGMEQHTMQPSAVLYGGLDYDIGPEAGDLLREGKDFCKLPGTRIEVDSIYRILSRNNYKVTLYTDEKGTQDSFMNLHGKRHSILHLATHGFYYSPNDAKSVDYLNGYADAMSLSGIVLSGANAAWREKDFHDGTSDGILTANDIARLDLEGVDMAVLSACKSGQGNATSEGLYGLQRAFKKAGVRRLVMTLWNVSDKVTTEFMVRFYEAMASNNWNEHKAFKQAKLQIKEQYPDPYHWAAFVLLD